MGEDFLLHAAEALRQCLDLGLEAFEVAGHLFTHSDDMVFEFALALRTRPAAPESLTPSPADLIPLPGEL
jgi:hypothetical protein